MSASPSTSPAAGWRRLGNSHSPVIDRVLTKKRDLQHAQASLTWMGANLTGAMVAFVERDFALFFGDLLLFLPFREGLLSCLVFLFLINALVDLFRFARPMISRGPAIELTEAEQKLLGVSPLDLAFKLATPPKASPSPHGLTFKHRASPSLSPNSSFVGLGASPLRSTTPSSLNQSLTNTSLGSLPSTPQPQKSPESTLNQRRSLSKIVAMDETISDHATLQEYLKEHEAQERMNRFSLPESSPDNNLNTSFWSPSRTSALSIADTASVLRKYQYQLASKSPQTTKNQGASDDPDNPNAITAEDVLAKYEVNDEAMMLWTMNLRNWISETIISPLVKEIETKNDKLRRTGHSDSLIGEAGLATIKRVAALDPSLDLNLLSPYLEIHDNQEYLVKRLRALSKGGCMSAYIANGGDAFKDKPWSEALPTDSAIVLHMFTTYLDSQLPITSFYPDLKAFSKQHILKSPEKPNLTKKENLMIYQSSLMPPAFKVVVGEAVYDVAKGHNNLFYAVVLFLLHVKNVEHGVLGKINLGLTGLNVLNILS